MGWVHELSSSASAHGRAKEEIFAERRESMEHLGNEDNGFAFDAKIRLYCDPPSFEKQSKTLDDFVELPKRLGWKIQENGEKELENGSLLLNQVMQRWLFFEILAQVFGHLPSYKAADFIRRDSSDQYNINTSKLPGYLERWLDSEKNSPPTERNRRLIRIQQVLDKARGYVSQYCTVQNLEANANWEINDLLALSFLVLGETLTRAQNRIQRKVGFCINGWGSQGLRNQGWGYSKTILQKLKTDGWCAKAINMLQALLRGNTIGLIYLFSLRESSSKGGIHGECTATECKVNEIRRKPNITIEPIKPKPYHSCSDIPNFWSTELTKYVKADQTKKNPPCTAVEDFDGYVEGKRLATIIDKGKIPLFEYNKDDRRLEVVEMSQSFDQSYAIFSHVWMDGFGSMDERNGMSLCVLDMFSNILKEITIQRAGGKSAVVRELFWIDSLALPVLKEFSTQRTKAIRQMHNIYTHARYTIVLDLSLMRVTSGSGYSNTAMKITMSRWMTRLWTLQEAVLSKNLFFCFNDRIYSMIHLEELFSREDSELHSCVPSLSRIYYDGILGEMRPKIHEGFWKDEGWQPSSDDLAAVWKAAQWRSTAYPIHETLSLATMLNVDTEYFARLSKWPEGSEKYQQDCDDRMIELLSRFAALSPCPIPPGFIFLPGPRLSEKGYSWAPRTWLSSCEIDSPDPLSLPDAGNTRLTPEGLEVQYPGFILHDLGDDRKNLRMRDDFYFSANSVLLDWYRVKPAEDTSHFPEAEDTKRISEDENKRRIPEAEKTSYFPEAARLLDRDLAIIVPRLPVLDLKETALFVAIKRHWAGIHYVEILNRVWISREERQDILRDLSRAHREGRSEAMTAGEKLPPHKKWCVDGSTQPSVVLEEKEREETQLSENNGHANDQPEVPAEPEASQFLSQPKRRWTMNIVKGWKDRVFSR